MRPREHLRLPRGRLPGHLEAAVDAGAGAGRRRGLRSPGAVGRLRVDGRACTCSWTASRPAAPCCPRAACRPAPSRSRSAPSSTTAASTRPSRPTTPATSTSTTTASATAIATWTTSASSLGVPAPAWDETRPALRDAVVRWHVSAARCGRACARCCVLGDARLRAAGGGGGGRAASGRRSRSRRSRPSATPRCAALRYDDGAAAGRSEQPRRRRSGGARSSASGCSSIRRFSGRLLEGDNDGTRGDARACGARRARSAARAATCPSSGFVDTRSPHRQVSLAAQWTLRRTPTLLEVAFAPLYNWDGRRDAIWNQALGVMESNREFNCGRLFVAEQLFRLHRAEYEALFGAMPPLDDADAISRRSRPRPPAASRWPRRRARRSPAAGMPGDGADYDGMAPADQDAGHDGGRQRRQGHRRLRAAAALRRRPLRRWLDGDAAALDAQPSSAAPRCSSGRASCVSLPRGPAPDRRRVPQRRPRARPPSPSRSRTSTIAAPRRASRAALDRSDEHGGRLQRRRPPAAARRRAAPELEGAFRTPTLRCAAVAPQLHAHRADHRARRRSSRSSIAAAIRRAAIRARTSCTRSRSPIGSAPISSRSWARSPVPVPTRRCWCSREEVPQRRAARCTVAGAVSLALRGVRAGGGGRRERRPSRRTRRSLPDVAASTTPSVPTTYVPQPGNCGFDTPAFCDTFEAGPAAGGRAGELDPARWSVARGAPYNSASFDDAFRIGPGADRRLPRRSLEHARLARRGRAGLRSDARRSPPATSLATAAEQNYGLATYRIRQPFDFAGRTGTIKLDIDLINNGLGGWPALIHRPGSVARAQLRLARARLGPAQRHRDRVRHRLVQHAADDGGRRLHVRRLPADARSSRSFDCDIPHAMTAPGALNHVEVYLTQTHLEVWASDTSPDGVTFPNLHLLWAGDVALPFSRGYVSLARAQPRDDEVLARLGGGGALGQRRLRRPRRDRLARVQRARFADARTGAARLHDVRRRLPVGGRRHPGQSPTTAAASCAPKTTCTYDGEGRNVGYVVPNVDENVAPVALHVLRRGPRRRDAGAPRPGRRSTRGSSGTWCSRRRRTSMLRFRWNGGAWHDRFITDVEANAFMDFNPSLGGAGAGAGLLNQVDRPRPRRAARRRQPARAAVRRHVDGHLPRHRDGRRSGARRRPLMSPVTVPRGTPERTRRRTPRTTSRS